MTKKCCVLFAAVTIVALAFRLPRLGERPMHGDEAVHAIKFGDLLEKGSYTYDSYEYHGPTLNYLTLVPAWLASEKKLTEVKEFTLRIVPVFFGVLLVLSVLLIYDGLGSGAAVCAALLTAISPAMVFFSRYYIQEMLLAFFTFVVIAAGYRYSRSGKILWAILAGVSVGLMHATKETGIIALAAMLLSLILLRLGEGLRRSGLLLTRRKNSTPNTNIKVKPMHIIAGIAAAVIVISLFFSSFFSNPRGIVDSALTYTTYFDRAGNNNIHIHPWYYYLEMLIFSRYGGGPIWTEAIIVILAAFGFVAAIKGKGLSFVNVSLLRFISFYTLFITAAYAVIPYKTPWCLLSFLHGMILLAGAGAVVLIRLVPKVMPRTIILCLLAGATFHLAWKAYQSNYVYYADSRNPYVYAHPTVEIYTAVEKVNYYAKAYSRGHLMYIDVIFPGHDYWPLPWYLRSFANVRYRDHVDFNETSAPLIIASPSVEADLMKKLYSDSIPFEQKHLYVFLFDEPYYIWLRPKIELSGYVRKDLWDAAQQELILSD